MALVIPHDAAESQYTVTEESPGGWFEEGLVSMSRLRNWIGGWVELITLRKPVEVDGKTYKYLICNEEGKLLNLPANTRASQYILMSESLGLNGLIVGNAVLLEEWEID